jgi:chromosome segregation ATPase
MDITFLKVLPLVAAIGIAVGSAGTSPAGQAKRRNQPTPAEAAASAAQETAGAAKDKLTAIKDELADLNKSVQQAKDGVKAAADALKRVESEIEDGQASSSSFGRARDAFRAAEKLHAAAREQALRSPQYKEKYDKAKQSDDTAALATLRKETLEGDATVQAAMTKLKVAKSVYEPLRTALFEGDENWTAANEELQSKKQNVKDAEDELHKAIAKERAAVADAKKAAAAAAQATAAANAQRSQSNPRHH